MYYGYLNLGGVELMNLARSAAYLGAFMPNLKVECDVPATLRTTLGHAAYVSPTADLAPWYTSINSALGRFYGLMPQGIQGADDSSREVSTTQFSGDGGIHTLPRYGTRNIRVKATAFGADEQAVSAGLAWLRDVLDHHCGPATTSLRCNDRVATMLDSLPVSGAASDRFRYIYQVEVLESLRVIKTYKLKTGGFAAEVEFLLDAGIPWAFTPTVRIGTINMDASQSTQVDAAGEDCGDQNDAYQTFIGDPYFTAIAQPPRPPVIKPPNILPVASWQRRALAIAATQSDRWGRMVPVLTVRSGSNDIQQLRFRFYRSDAPLTGCDYDGEFYLSYLPVNHTLTIDGIRREVTAANGAGNRVPAAHLLYGSDGKPFEWPSFACHSEYTLVADQMPGNTLITFDLDIAIRE